ncbi:hypothetical protein CDD83_2619 [Cordyceps sp. RAO-2017]|nr:hypothetical protein CDD83_2619 [Cordyceps sp. RAO-2017]
MKFPLAAALALASLVSAQQQPEESGPDVTDAVSGDVDARDLPVEMVPSAKFDRLLFERAPPQQKCFPASCRHRQDCGAGCQGCSKSRVSDEYGTCSPHWR